MEGGSTGHLNQAGRVREFFSISITVLCHEKLLNLRECHVDNITVCRNSFFIFRYHEKHLYSMQFDGTLWQDNEHILRYTCTSFLRGNYKASFRVCFRCESRHLEATTFLSRKNTQWWRYSFLLINKLLIRKKDIVVVIFFALNRWATRLLTTQTFCTEACQQEPILSRCKLYWIEYSTYPDWASLFVQKLREPLKAIANDIRLQENPIANWKSSRRC